MSQLRGKTSCLLAVLRKLWLWGLTHASGFSLRTWLYCLHGAGCHAVALSCIPYSLEWFSGSCRPVTHYQDCTMDCDWEVWHGVIANAAWSRVGRCIHFVPLLHMGFLRTQGYGSFRSSHIHQCLLCLLAGSPCQCTECYKSAAMLTVRVRLC